MGGEQLADEGAGVPCRGTGRDVDCREGVGGGEGCDVGGRFVGVGGGLVGGEDGEVDHVEICFDVSVAFLVLGTVQYHKSTVDGQLDEFSF